MNAMYFPQIGGLHPKREEPFAIWVPGPVLSEGGMDGRRQARTNTDGMVREYGILQDPPVLRASGGLHRPARGDCTGPLGGIPLVCAGSPVVGWPGGIRGKEDTGQRHSRAHPSPALGLHEGGKDPLCPYRERRQRHCSLDFALLRKREKREPARTWNG